MGEGERFSIDFDETFALLFFEQSVEIVSGGVGCRFGLTLQCATAVAGLKTRLMLAYSSLARLLRKKDSA